MPQEKPAWTFSPHCTYMQSANKKVGLSSAVLLKQVRAGLFISLIHSTMITSVALLCLGIVILVFLLRSQRPKNFPPGPAVLPLLGSILELALDNPLQDFERVRKTAINNFRGIFNFLICVIAVTYKCCFIFEGSARVTIVLWSL